MNFFKIIINPGFIFAVQFFLCSGCSSNKPKETKFKEHSITLIKLGLDFDGLNSKQARGFGVNYYCYIDLQTDSVYTRREESLGSEFKEYSTIENKAGFVKNVGSDKSILNGLKAIDSLPSKYTSGLEPFSCKRNSNVPYFIRYVKGDSKEEVFFCLNETIDADFIYLVNKINQLPDLPSLTKLKDFAQFNEDSVTLKILEYKALDSVSDQPPVVKVRRILL